ncbi:MAG: SURF1 family protein [Pseudomonadota bacterium]
MSTSPAGRRPVWVDVTLLLLAAVIFVVLVGLGNWQLRRLDWKLTLIETVEARAYSAPVSPPDATAILGDHNYRRVAVAGRFRHDLTRQVKAVTELGPGHWIMVPLQTERGHVWINRGFVPTGLSASERSDPAGVVRVEGLVRLTEPDGTLLETNTPETGRWVSRDIAALSRDAGLNDTLPYFIDADHAGEAAAWPRGGLTTLTFRNPHFQYAITWYAMAVLFLAGIMYVSILLFRERRHRAE